LSRIPRFKAAHIARPARPCGKGIPAEPPPAGAAGLALIRKDELKLDQICRLGRGCREHMHAPIIFAAMHNDFLSTFRAFSPPFEINANKNNRLYIWHTPCSLCRICEESCLH
jgi:hypothetical protein